MDIDKLTWVGFLLLVWVILITLSMSERLDDAVGFTTQVALLVILAILTRLDRRIRELEAVKK